MRALMPWANGSWPAFWMMPQHSLYGGWPDSGEIDILEYVGWDNDHAHVNAHSKDRNFLIGTNYGWSGHVGGLESDYHTYGIEWWYDRIDFYIDGVWRYGFSNEDTGSGDWPFNSEFFIILNHAIGGWGGIMGIDTAAYDTVDDNYGVGFFVDWVRAYQWDWPDHDVPSHVEAEHYEGYGGDIREQKCDDVGGGWNVGYIDTGDFMQYRFEVPEAGMYQVDYRVASNGGGGIVTLGKGGVDLRQTTIPDTGGWQEWQTVSDQVGLESGPQLLDVYATSGGWNLNHLKLIPAPPATHIEAEYYTSMHGVQDEVTWDDGGGLNIGYVDDGDYMNYEVEIATPGRYQITYRVASEVDGSILTLGRGGEDIVQTAVPNTGGWQNWQTLTETVELEAGDQTLTLYATRGGWNLNWWRFELLDPDYARWEAANRITGSGRAVDVDDDGRANELEYYFGTNPQSGSEDPSRLPAAGIQTHAGADYPSFTFTRRLDSPKVSYGVEVSRDLRTWTPATRADGGTDAFTFTQISDSGDHGDGTHTISYRYNTESSGSRLFFRLRAEERAWIADSRVRTRNTLPRCVTGLRPTAVWIGTRSRPCASWQQTCSRTT